MACLVLHAPFGITPCSKRTVAFRDLQAWLWLVSEAKFKSGTYGTYAGDVFLDRGELCHSEAFMAEAWGWHKSKVHRYLNRLIREGMLDRTAKCHWANSNRTDKRTSFQVFSIRNYNKFQLVALPNRTNLTASNGEPGVPTEPTTEPTTAEIIPYTARLSGPTSDVSEPTTEPTLRT